MHGTRAHIGGIGGIVLMLLWFFIGVAGLTATTIFLVAMWRWMRAHETVAERLGEIAEVFRSREDGDVDARS